MEKEFRKRRQMLTRNKNGQFLEREAVDDEDHLLDISCETWRNPIQDKLRKQFCKALYYLLEDVDLELILALAHRTKGRAAP